MAADLEIQKRVSELKSGEIVEWHIQETSYINRFKNDYPNTGIYVEGYINEIKRFAEKYGGKVRIRWYKNKNILAQNINTSIKGTARKGDQLISRFTYYGHGSPGALWLKYSGSKIDYSINNKDISTGLLLKVAFSNDCKAISWACNSSTKTGKGKKEASFAGNWHSYFGFEMQGAIGKTDYYPTHESHWKFWHKPKPPIPGNNGGRGRTRIVIPGPGE